MLSRFSNEREDRKEIKNQDKNKKIRKKKPTKHVLSFTTKKLESKKGKGYYAAVSDSNLLKTVKELCEKYECEIISYKIYDIYSRSSFVISGPREVMTDFSIDFATILHGMIEEISLV